MTPPTGRYGRRLALAVGAVVACALAATGLALTGELRARLIDDLSRGLEVQARLAALRAGEKGPLKEGSAQSEARSLAQACGCRATLIAPDGRLAGDSELDDAALARAENHATRPEVASAFAGAQTVAQRRSVTVGRDMLYAAAPILRGGALLGAARLSMPLTEADRQVARVRALVLWTTLAALLAALAAVVLLARGASRPVREMADAAARLAAGDYSARVRSSGDDELSLLARTLNELAARVQEDIERLRRLERTRRDFVANVSHELRTPLSSIKGYAETLRSGAVDDRENRLDFLRTIEAQADRLTKLVDDLLDLSAIESGHRAPRLAPTDLSAALAESVRAFKTLADERRVSLSLAPSPDLPRASVDPDQLRQIMANLLDNALKYTEPGGRVDVGAEPWPGGARVTVRDTGVGIPEAHLPRVFERFYRADKARSREAGGTGLGLSIVKHLVEAQGGEVSVESRRPGGSAFRFTVRAA